MIFPYLLDMTATVKSGNHSDRMTLNQISAQPCYSGPDLAPCVGIHFIDDVDKVLVTLYFLRIAMSASRFTES